MPDKRSNREIRLRLDEELEEKIKKIMDYYGIKNTTEIVRLVIGIEYRRIEEREIKLKGPKKKKRERD